MRKKSEANKGLDLEVADGGGGDEKNRKRQQEKLLMSHSNNEHQVNKSIITREQRELSRDPSTSTSDEMEFKNKNNVNFKRTWIFILLPMTIALLLTASLIVILIFPTLLDIDDKCFNSFQQTNYKLFATKTTYTSAIDYINQSSPSGLSHSKSNTIFQASKSQTLADLNNHLLSKTCKLKQFHYIGRHAARYPSTDDISRINKLVDAIKNRIEPSKYNISSFNNNANNSVEATPAKICLNPLAEFESWKSPLTNENGNLISDFGIEETRAIAERFRSIYPNMFDATQTKIEFGVTKEIRTAQTALIFYDLISSPESFNPSQENHKGTQLTDKVRDLRSLKAFIDSNRATKLEFHDTCESYHETDYKLPYNLELNRENRTAFISESISKKLKLNREDYLSRNETEAIYDMCKYETALVGPSRANSIWCNLFSESQLKFFEFINDVSKFFKVYGHPNQARSACPVTTELMKSFKSIKNQQHQYESQSFFYFTHSQVIEKIMANLIELESDQGYVVKNVLEHLDAGTVPENREWRSSLLSPFSANIAFSVYDCSSNDALDIRIVTSVNEKPIVIDGCDDVVCNLDRILDDGKINKEKRCKLEEICKKNIKVT